MVCRSTGSGSCTAEYQRLPLTVTVALDSQVGATGSAHLFQSLGSKKKGFGWEEIQGQNFSYVFLIYCLLLFTKLPNAKICYIGLENAYIAYLIEVSKLYSKIEKRRKSKKEENNDNCVSSHHRRAPLRVSCT